LEIDEVAEGGSKGVVAGLAGERIPAQWCGEIALDCPAAPEQRRGAFALEVTHGS
jgi:hypothetical protein